MPIAGRQHNIRKWTEVVLLGALALYFSAFIGEDVLERETWRVDGVVRTWALAHQHRALGSFFEIVTTIGAPNPLAIVSILAALYLWRRGRPFTASTVLVAPAAALATYEITKRLYARVRPPGLGGITETGYSFPSGHATASAAICCTLAYVFWEEGIIPGAVAAVVAVVLPVLIGVSRLYLDVHWATDVLGGWSAGLLIAALSMALYRAVRRPA